MTLYTVSYDHIPNRNITSTIGLTFDLPICFTSLPLSTYSPIQSFSSNLSIIHLPFPPFSTLYIPPPLFISMEKFSMSHSLSPSPMTSSIIHLPIFPIHPSLSNFPNSLSSFIIHGVAYQTSTLCPTQFVR
jgi:hypothetical protein